MRLIAFIATAWIALPLAAGAREPAPGCAGTGPQPGGAAPLAAAEVAALDAAARPPLEELRAGSALTGAAIDGFERLSLREAGRRDPGLDRLRAGELSLTDREVELILITAGIVIVIALIL